MIHSVSNLGMRGQMGGPHLRLAGFLLVAADVVGPSAQVVTGGPVLEGPPSVLAELQGEFYAGAAAGRLGVAG